MSVVIPGMNLEHERVEFRPRTVRCCLQSLAPSVALPAWYAEQGLCSSKLSIHLSVCLSICTLAGATCAVLSCCVVHYTRSMFYRMEKLYCGSISRHAVSNVFCLPH